MRKNLHNSCFCAASPHLLLREYWPALNVSGCWIHPGRQSLQWCSDLLSTCWMSWSSQHLETNDFRNAAFDFLWKHWSWTNHWYAVPISTNAIFRTLQFNNAKRKIPLDGITNNCMQVKYLIELNHFFVHKIKTTNEMEFFDESECN